MNPGRGGSPSLQAERHCGSRSGDAFSAIEVLRSSRGGIPAAVARGLRQTTWPRRAQPAAGHCRVLRRLRNAQAERAAADASARLCNRTAFVTRVPGCLDRPAAFHGARVECRCMEVERVPTSEGVSTRCGVRNGLATVSIEVRNGVRSGWVNHAWWMTGTARTGLISTGRPKTR